ncbi:MAG: protein-L-isoaspartate(D-aspartate) O-methyltransferase [Deltaproteobacteria bacterium]|jgi:protein-L-isoaspartate(D-aspartate) O-methyltransferase|nr:protein-L-isoaspartate(D-aspartate) O-methyltransferase [Deltaproteobacteria bacterium]
MKDLFQKQRIKMVETQIRSRGITSPAVLAAMETIPRHIFIDEALQAQAYQDNPLPIGEGQTISQPYIVALMTQAMEITKKDKVLEIGTGSGYQTAILAELADQVFSIERIANLASGARKCLDALGYFNVAIRVGDGTYGWKEEAPFHSIIVTASGPTLPNNLLSQLVVGGRIVLPIGDHRMQTLYKVTRLSEDLSDIRQDNLGGCRFVDLIGDFAWGSTVY